MGCFLGCFGKKKKDRKRRKPANKVLPREQRHGCYEPLESNVSPKQQEEITENPISPVLETSEKIEEQLSLSTRKRVTFDLNVKAYEEVSTHEITESDDEEEEKGKKEDKISRSTSLSEDDSNTSSLVSFPSNHRYGNCRNSDDEFEEMESDEDIDLDDEDDDDDDDDDDYDDDDEEEDRRLGDVESSESFFSLPMEARTRTSGTSVTEKEVNSPLKVSGSLDEETQPLQSNRNARDRSQYVHSVLNPVENLTQWKAIKAKTSSPSPLKAQKKENINLEQEPNIPFSPEPTFKLSPFSFNSNSHQSTSPPSKQEQAELTFKLSSFSFNSNSHQSTSPPSKQELAVDTSLSNWLGSSETTPSTKTSNLSVGNNRIESGEVVDKFQRSNSPRSQEDRPILGALTLEEIKLFSATSSPRRSPTHSPDDKPILGTVGSYWSHTDQTMESSSNSSCKGIPNTTSKYREDKRVNWHSTPFETRLERALNKGAAEAYTSF